MTRDGITSKRNGHIPPCVSGVGRLAASGVALSETVAVCKRLDAIPELAGKELAEPNLREAPSGRDKVSVLKV